MRNLLGLLLVLLSFIIPLQSAAQKEYRGLLWEISGNGLDEKSYLYGTMHVSSKIAFHLSDSFFINLKSCDAVALETNPQDWLSDMDRLGLFSDFTPSNYVQSSGFYESAFELSIPENQDLAGIIAQDNDMINPMLRRLQRGGEDYSEDTYLDLFLYQAGVKQNKKIFNLETYKQSLLASLEAQIPDEKEDDQARKYKLQQLREKGKDVSLMIQDAYRRGNLNTIDSLSQLTSSKKYHKLMIVKRNRIMAKNLDSLLQLYNVFTGIGAAHLPGDSGVIEMLRDKGYKLRPVENKQSRKGKRMWKRLEKKRTDHPLDTFFVSSDSMIKVKTPGLMIALPNQDEQRDYLYSDMGNGAFYSITRKNTYSWLQNQDLDYMEKRMDSLFYENIPGDIVKQDKIERFGFSGYEIVNKTVRGDIQQYQILITPLELVVFKMGGTGKYLKKVKYDEAFFSSIEFMKKPSSNWENFVSNAGGFSVDIPAYHDRKGNADYGAKIGTYHELIQAYDAEDKSYFSILQRSLHDMEYIETDSFELRMLIKNFAEEHNYDIESKELSKLASGQPAFKGVLSSEEKGNLHYQCIIRNAQFYLLLAKSSNETKTQKFFESFQFKTPKAFVKYEEVEDTSLLFSVQTIPQQGEKYRYYQKNRSRYNSSKKKKYEYNSENRPFFNVHTAEVVEVDFYKYHDYYCIDDLEVFWERVKDNLADEDEIGLYVSSFEQEKKDYYDVTNYEIRDSFSVRRIKGKFVWKKGAVYSLNTVYDSLDGLSKFQSTFLSSFKPFKDTAVGQPLFENKGDYFLSNIKGDDSTQRENAFKSLYYYVEFEDEHKEELKKVVDEFEFEDDEKRYHAELLERLGLMEDKDLIPYFEKKYKESADERPDLQFAALQALAEFEDSESYRTFKKLIVNDPPLSSGYEIGNMFYRLDDSLELSKNLFPEMLELTEFDEYEEEVYQLLAALVDSNITDGGIYKSRYRDIYRDARYALKRQQSKDAGEDKTYVYDDYYDDDYHQSLWSKNELAYFCSMLIPFNDDKKAAALLVDMLEIDDLELRLQIAMTQMNAGLEIDEKVWTDIAEEKATLPILYDELKAVDKTELIPEERLTQYNLAHGRLYEYGYDEDEDSTELMNVKHFNYGEKVYTAYFFKSKEEDDEEWEMDLIAFERNDSSELETKAIFEKKGIDFNEDDKEDLEETMNEYMNWFPIMDRKRVKDISRSSYYNYYGY